MPAPYDYTVAQPNVGSYFDAVRQGRTDRLATEQEARNNALSKYLPGALKGDEGQREGALEASVGDPNMTLELSKVFAGADQQKIAKAKEVNGQLASLAIWADTPDKWPIALAEARKISPDIGDIPFEQRGVIIAKFQTVSEQLEQAYRAAMLANDTSRTTAQNALTSAQITALRNKPGAGGGGFDNTTFDNMSGLRKEYVNATKDFGVVSDAYGRIKATANSATPAGDLSMIYAYMKMLDPGSVVRESEFALAQNAKPLLDRLGISWDAVKSAWEGTKLQPQVRADFLKQAASLYEQQTQQKGQVDQQYTTLANRFGFDPSLVVTGRPSIPADQPPPSQQTPQTFVRGGAGVFSNEPAASPPSIIRYDAKGRRIP